MGRSFWDLPIRILYEKNEILSRQVYFLKRFRAARIYAASAMENTMESEYCWERIPPKTETASVTGAATILLLAVYTVEFSPSENTALAIVLDKVFPQ